MIKVLEAINIFTKLIHKKVLVNSENHWIVWAVWWPVIHIWEEAENDVVLSKEAALVQIIHVVVVLVENLDGTLLDQIEVLELVIVVHYRLTSIIDLAFNVDHKLGNDTNVHSLLVITMKERIEKPDLAIETFLK